MSNPNKSKGTRAETSVVRFLNKKGWCAKRQPLSGNKDRGDIEAVPEYPLTIEVKAGGQTHNPSRKQIEEWITQAKREASNNGTVDWMLIIVRYRRQLKDADVYYGDLEEVGQDPHHCWLDELEDLN